MWVHLHWPWCLLKVQLSLFFKHLLLVAGSLVGAAMTGRTCVVMCGSGKGLFWKGDFSMSRLHGFSIYKVAKAWMLPPARCWQNTCGTEAKGTLWTEAAGLAVQIPAPVVHIPEGPWARHWTPIAPTGERQWLAWQQSPIGVWMWCEWVTERLMKSALGFHEGAGKHSPFAISSGLPVHTCTVFVLIIKHVIKCITVIWKLFSSMTSFDL